MDDLKQWLRLHDECCEGAVGNCGEAADRIERLEREVRDHAEWAATMMADPTSEPYRILRDRIERLEDALRTLLDQWTSTKGECMWCWQGEPGPCAMCVARRALDGEDTDGP